MSETPLRDRRIIEEASRWVTLLEEGSLSGVERQELASWLRASPHHVRELLLTQTIYADADGIDPDKAISIDGLLAMAGADVVPLQDSTNIHHTTRFAWLQRTAWPSLAVAVLIAVAAVFFSNVLYFNESQYDDFTTQIGEQRSLTLEDGSIVHMNTYSKVQVRFSTHERAITLINGEALFDVYHDATRPFRVYSDGAVTEALGTSFNVYQKNGGTEVAVLEGSVALSSRSSGKGTAAKNTTLVAGEVATVDTTGNVKPVQAANMLAITSWRKGQLVFEDTPLSEIVREFNRYNQERIEIIGIPHTGLRFSGVFDTRKPDAFLTTLKISGAARIDRKQGVITIDLLRPPR